MKILYLHCFSGISGDMTVAALADAGADVKYIEGELQKLQLDPYTISWGRVNKSGISALKFDVIPDPDNPPKHHRHYSDIVKMIEDAKLSPKTTERSIAVFKKIGEAEAKIHDIPLEKIHFHEVGAIDSIVDVVAVALALESLHADRLIASPVALGSGTIKIDHGLYPVPAPATLEMMKGVPIQTTEHQMELTTPTGAGIISALVDGFSDTLPAMMIEAIGYGAGTKDLPRQPNVLRAVLGNSGQETALLAEKELHMHHHHHHHGHDDHHHHHE